MRTVILDDEEPIVRLLSRVCVDEGHQVKGFTSSEEALVYLAAEPVDMLITDMNMPGLDGPAVVGKARALQPNIFVLVITGHSAQYPLDAILADGTADVMFKPFHMNELRARLALAERRQQWVSKVEREWHELQAASSRMIDGLEAELQELRKPDFIR